MKSIVAWTCAGWLTVPGAQPPSTAPLAFGMTPHEAAQALGAPLHRISGHRSSEIFYASHPASVPGVYPVAERVFLQFRNGCLTGWKKDWRMPPRGFF